MAHMAQESFPEPDTSQLLNSEKKETRDLSKIKIADLTFNVKKTDGVALQVQANVEELERQKLDVMMVGADTFPELDFLDYQSPEATSLRERMLTSRPDPNIEPALLAEISEKAKIYKQKLGEFFTNNEIKIAHIRNIMSLPFLNLPLAIAIRELIEENPRMLFVLHHHDIDWEGPMSKRFQTHYSDIADLADRVKIPNLKNTAHIAINSIAADEIWKRRGVHTEVIPDGYNFDRPVHPIDNQKFREDIGVGEGDLLVGMMTRVRINKGIQDSIKFIATFAQQLKHSPRGFELNGRKVNKDTHIVLLVPQAKDLDAPYFSKLQKYAKELNVDFRFIGDKVVSDADYVEGSHKYPFYSTYLPMDFILYTSHHEGYGNQAIEAARFRKLLIMHLYSVAARDIMPHNPGIIPMGTEDDLESFDDSGLLQTRQAVVDESVRKTMQALSDPSLHEEMVERNYHRFKELCDIRQISARYIDIYQKYWSLQ